VVPRILLNKSLFPATIVLVCATVCGCSRAIREGTGAARGASGKVFELDRPSGLTDYEGFKIGDLTTSNGLKVPDDLNERLSEALVDALKTLGLSQRATPAIRVSGEVIHFESGSAVSKAIGPLQEIILRTQLSDAGSNRSLGEANLIGRSKALTSSGTRNLCEGVGRAIKEWFEEHGFEELDEDT
jgi:hypothetical protein